MIVFKMFLKSQTKIEDDGEWNMTTMEKSVCENFNLFPVAKSSYE